MDTQELKAHFLAEHKRDMRLTFIAYGLVALVVLIIGILLYQYAWNAVKETAGNFSSELTEGPTADYLPIIIPVFVLGVLFYPVYQLYRISQRSKKIDELIGLAEEGRAAQRIGQKTVYKITIPLLKINFKLAPVEYAQINMEESAVLYDLPIPIHVIPDMKVALSGAKQENYQKAWSELYLDENEASGVEEATPLPDTEAFKAYVNNSLSEAIEGVESSRSKGKKQYIIYLAIGVVIALGWIGIQYGMSTGSFQLSTPVLLGGFFGFFVVFYAVMYFTRIRGSKSSLHNMDGNNVNHTFKKKVFLPMIHFINPSFQFVIHGHLSLPEFMETGFFRPKNYNIDGNDQIIGRHAGVPFQICDLNVDYKRNFSNEKDGPDEVFYGQAFVARFNKSFEHDLYLVPKKTGGLLKSSNDIKDYLDDLGEKVVLEDQEFMKLFHVYCTDQVEARYILTPALMERIKQVVGRNGKQLFIAFRNDRISILNNSRSNNFESSLFKSVNSESHLLGFYQDLTDQLALIEDLKLNVKIWKKQLV